MYILTGYATNVANNNSMTFHCEIDRYSTVKYIIMDRVVYFPNRECMFKVWNTNTDKTQIVHQYKYGPERVHFHKWC